MGTYLAHHLPCCPAEGHCLGSWGESRRVGVTAPSTAPGSEETLPRRGRGGGWSREGFLTAGTPRLGLENLGRHCQSFPFFCSLVDPRRGMVQMGTSTWTHPSQQACALPTEMPASRPGHDAYANA